jgi:hypothetical protein
MRMFEPWMPNPDVVALGRRQRGAAKRLPRELPTRSGARCGPDEVKRFANLTTLAEAFGSRKKSRDGKQHAHGSRRRKPRRASGTVTPATVGECNGLASGARP